MMQLHCWFYFDRGYNTRTYVCTFEPRFWFPNKKNSRGGSGFPVTAVTEKSRMVTGRIKKTNFEIKFAQKRLLAR